MSTQHTVDAKKRIILPDARPGEVIDVEYIGGGAWRLRRVNHALRQVFCKDCGANVPQGDTHCKSCFDRY